jgi:hypothetical protein
VCLVGRRLYQFAGSYQQQKQQQQHQHQQHRLKEVVLMHSIIVIAGAKGASTVGSKHSDLDNG